MARSVRARRRFRWLGAPVALLLAVMAVPILGTSPVQAAGDITITAYACSPGFDAGSAGFGDFQAQCTAPYGGLAYDVSVDGVSWSTVTGGPNGETLIQGVPDGMVYIKEQPPQGYSAAAFCAFYQSGQTPSYAFYGDSGVAGQMGASDLLDCLWYLVPTGQPETTSVTIAKYWCPESYDAYSASQSNLQQNCQESYGGTVSFILSAGDGSQSEQTVTGQGLVEWPQTPLGNAAIDEAVPGGYGVPRSFCRTTDSNGNQSPTDELQVTSDGVLSVLLESGKFLYCEWFNIPGETGEIVIVKHWCPQGYTAPHDLDELYQNCTDTYPDPVLFELYGSSSGSAGAQETGDVVPDGIHFVGLPLDTWTVREVVPADRGIPIVFCKAIDLQSGDETDVSEATIYEGSSIVWPMESAGLQLSCDWFNTGERTGAGVYIRKHVCPEGYEPESGYDALMVECTGESDKVEFTVSWPDNNSAEQTTSGDQLIWEGLPPGDFEIRESIPQGYGPPIAYCSQGHYLEGANDYEEVDVTDSGALEWQLGELEYLECDWFNLPAEGGPATLIIVKALCPEEYDIFDWEADPSDDCDETQNGVTFRLSDEDGNQEEGTTGDEDDGTVVFEEIEPGTYLLEEVWPEEERELVYAFVAGCESTVRAFDAYPFDPFVMIGWRSAIRIELLPGEELRCAWYDVPERPAGEAAITIVTYDCPGTNVNPSACDPAEADVFFELVPVDNIDADPIEAETGPDGTVTVEVPAGDYELKALDDDPCFVSSDAFSDEGFLVVNPGDAIDVQVYNCAG